jgi:hypothetical protein
VGFEHVDWNTAVADMLVDADNPTQGSVKRLKEGFLGNPFVIEAPEPRAVFYDEDFSSVRFPRSSPPTRT